MNLAVVAFPELEADASRWIEAVRETYDPDVRRIAAHFTLVFPFNLRPDDVYDDIVRVASTTGPFGFDIARVSIVDSDGTSFLFLVPGTGAPEIEALHGRLYAGALRTQLRTDLEFTPHMTLGRNPDRHVAEACAERLRASMPLLSGEIRQLDLVDVDRMPVQSIGSFPLNAG
ncbi:MAG TPA: 2'-5' RNA ligase family protein [Coriobacteriia bacterium]